MPRRLSSQRRILNEEVEHEAWFIEVLSKERDGKVRPSGHFRRGEPGEAPYSKNRGFYAKLDHSERQIDSCGPPEA